MYKSKEPAVSVTPEFSQDPVRLVQKPPDENEERIVIFTMERPGLNPGDPPVVEEYTIPKRQRPSVGLRYLYEMKYLGDQMATVNMLENVLGADAFMALMAHDDLTPEQNERIQRMVLKYTMGDQEAGKGAGPGSKS